MFSPTQSGEFELVEKKSRFIARVWQVDSEDQAKEHIAHTKKKFHDARHHCYCYRIDPQQMRYSDDGEPQGTAGQPMLHLLEQEDMVRTCCVVTRYFGGVLLGTGGLVRAYTHAAKGAIEAAGISCEQQMSRLLVSCDYSLYERVENTILSYEGSVDNADFGADVTLEICLAEQSTQELVQKLVEVSAGKVQTLLLGNERLWVPIK